MASEPLNFCLICANIYSSPNYVPITFKCGHTFCSTCVAKKNHYKQFGFKEGLCIVDRTEILAGKEGRVNKSLLQYLNFYDNQIKSSMQVIQKLEETQIKNQKLSDKIESMQNRYITLGKQKVYLQEELKQSIKNQRITGQVVQTSEEKQLQKKLQSLRKMNQIKLARRQQLKYMIEKYREGLI